MDLDCTGVGDLSTLGFHAKSLKSLPLFVWHAHSDSGGRGELWQVFAGDSHALRTSERATPVSETGRNFRFLALAHGFRAV
jgi:hypothetical protein